MSVVWTARSETEVYHNPEGMTGNYIETVCGIYLNRVGNYAAHEGNVEDAEKIGLRVCHKCWPSPSLGFDSAPSFAPKPRSARQKDITQQRRTMKSRQPPESSTSVDDTYVIWSGRKSNRYPKAYHKPRSRDTDFIKTDCGIEFYSGGHYGHHSGTPLQAERAGLYQCTKCWPTSSSVTQSSPCEKEHSMKEKREGTKFTSHRHISSEAEKGEKASPETGTAKEATPVHYKVEVWLYQTSAPLVHRAINTYIKDSFYCVYDVRQMVYKYPSQHIFRVVEEYKVHGGGTIKPVGFGKSS